MSIEFTSNKEDEVILITLSGTISAEDINGMRRKTIELLNETGIKNYVVDMTAVTSMLEQKTTETYQMGKKFKEIVFPYSTKTAVILPRDDEARTLATFLHTVEINRVRGPMKYVSSYEEALDWFRS